MVRTHYPPYIKTVLKAGAIFHLMFMGSMMMMGWGRYRELWKNSKPRRRAYKAGKFDFMLQGRDEYAREVIRPALNWQPNMAFQKTPDRVLKIIH
jgi:hypothetical protein